ncbi:MAG: hypothetical protein LBS08_01120 [Candidatus Symbiothrix sp.]|nr:hypothetical protein [Candidatus Symbiothrix sp.]
MLRQIFTPTPQSPTFPVTVPDEWYGMDVEIIAFPVSHLNSRNNNTNLVKEQRQQKEEIRKKYSFSRNGYRFDREEANNYE